MYGRLLNKHLTSNAITGLYNTTQRTQSSCIYVKPF